MRYWFAASIAFAAALVPALPAGAAWFSDNGDREALPLLRARAGDSPDPTERALLDAANRIGWVQIPECGWGSNAVLVNIAGQDYAITSLHLLTGKGPGDVHCAPGLAADPRYATDSGHSAGGVSSTPSAPAGPQGLAAW